MVWFVAGAREKPKQNLSLASGEGVHNNGDHVFSYLIHNPGIGREG